MGNQINNIKEFLTSRGFEDNPYYWARCLYKYTDCGPWVSFVVLDEPAKDEPEVAVIECVNNRPHLTNRITRDTVMKTNFIDKITQAIKKATE